MLTDVEGAAEVREEEPEAPREVPLPEEAEPLWEPDTGADTDGVEIGAVGVLETIGVVADEWLLTGVEDEGLEKEGKDALPDPLELALSDSTLR